MTRFGRFFLPGPTEVHPDVLQAMVRPMIPHRGPACAELFERLQPTLRALYGTARPVYVAASSGTGMMEAGVRALKKGRVLALVNGAFSERYAQIAEVCGHEVERFEVAWGETHDPGAVAERVVGFDGLTLAHSETSTGALQPLEAIAAAAGDTPVLVDTVTSFGATAIDFDRLGLAYACAGSQKALAVPPGLAFAVASETFLARARRASFYFDLDAYEKRPPPYTPALPLVYALEAALERVEREGLAARFERHAAMARRTKEWAGEQGLVLAGHGSPTVTCLRPPDGWTGPEVAAALSDRGYVVGTGYGKWKQETFRIGHMGDQTMETLEALLGALSDTLVR